MSPTSLRRLLDVQSAEGRSESVTGHTLTGSSCSSVVTHLTAPNGPGAGDVRWMEFLVRAKLVVVRFAAVAGRKSVGIVHHIELNVIGGIGWQCGRYGKFLTNQETLR